MIDLIHLKPKEVLKSGEIEIIEEYDLKQLNKFEVLEYIKLFLEENKDYKINIKELDNKIKGCLKGDNKDLKEIKRNKKYLTKCVFCGKEFITEKNTANEGICYSCRSV